MIKGVVCFAHNVTSIDSKMAIRSGSPLFSIQPVNQILITASEIIYLI